MPTKTFDAQDFETFLKLLPTSHEGHALRHVVEVRHESFLTEEFTGMLSTCGVAAVMAGDAKHPQIADPTAPFVYAWIMGTVENEPLGYSKDDLDLWAERMKTWARGDLPDGLNYVRQTSAVKRRDVYLYVISGHKQRNPQAAMALIERTA